MNQWDQPSFRVQGDNSGMKVSQVIPPEVRWILHQIYPPIHPFTSPTSAKPQTLSHTQQLENCLLALLLILSLCVPQKSDIQKFQWKLLPLPPPSTSKGPWEKKHCWVVELETRDRWSQRHRQRWGNHTQYLEMETGRHQKDSLKVTLCIEAASKPKVKKFDFKNFS